MTKAKKYISLIQIIFLKTGGNFFNFFNFGLWDKQKLGHFLTRRDRNFGEIKYRNVGRYWKSQNCRNRHFGRNFSRYRYRSLPMTNKPEFLIKKSSLQSFFKSHSHWSNISIFFLVLRLNETFLYVIIVQHKNLIFFSNFSYNFATTSATVSTTGKDTSN